jgi:hypothetical protein
VAASRSPPHAGDDYGDRAIPPSGTQLGGIATSLSCRVEPSHRTTAGSCPPGAPRRWSGIVLEWRQNRGPRWERRVAPAPHLQNGHALVELWLPAEVLHAGTPTPPR